MKAIPILMMIKRLVGIISVPDNKTWLYDEKGSGVTQVFALTIEPDATFSTNATGDNSEFSQVDSQAANTISVYPKNENTSGDPYIYEITVSATGYDDEVITVTQETD